MAPGVLVTTDKPLDALLERVLAVNIKSSDYFRELFANKAVADVIDEIYLQVDNVEPWMTGNCRGPSTAFCLLYKLFTLHPDAKEMRTLLDHGDSPYIRAVGFLYLRYLADPKTLWDWYEPYLVDEEEFAPGTNGKMTTMGAYVRDLFLGQYYFDTLFPRIPVPVLRQVTASLEAQGLPTQPSGLAGSANRAGAEDGARRPPSVKAALSVSFGQRAPHRASTRDSSPVRRGSASGRTSDARNGERDKDGDRGRERDRDRAGGRERLDYSRRSGDSRGREDDKRAGDRKLDSRSQSPYQDRSRRSSGYENDRGRREPERERDRDTRSYKDRDSRRDDREGDRSRDYTSERGRDRDRNGDRIDNRDKDQYGDKERERSRSRSRSRDRETKNANSNLQKLKNLYGDASTSTRDQLSAERARTSSAEDVIRLGASTWR
eukprot:SM000294S10818  [mRNA]  locus=s294:4634:6609:+ [translate_table: standard]